MPATVRTSFLASIAVCLSLLVAACSGGDDSEAVSGTQIVAHPSDQTVSVGQQATFAVATSGPEPVSYQWFKGSDSIPGANNARYTTPPVVQADDGYAFWVEIHIRAAERTVPVPSSMARLTVLPGFIPTSGSFAATGSLAAARNFHTATLLQDGRVLIVGGSGAFGGFLSSAELYDPATGLFTPTGSLLRARSQHTATLLASGKVLVAGGYTDGSSPAGAATAELYDPVTGTFSAAGTLARPRAQHSAVRLSNGKVLLSRGDMLQISVPDGTAELYDPMTQAFSLTGSTITPRAAHQALLLTDGRVALVGGNTTSSSNADIYDPTSATFATLALSTAPAIGSASLMLPNGKALLVGGQNAGNFVQAAQSVDFATGSTAMLAPLLFVRSGASATLVAADRVLVFGGRGAGRMVERAELYDMTANTFAVTGGYLTGREFHTATRLNNGRVLIAGGSSNGPALSSVILYTP
jgi:hypothetical protein